MEPKRITLNCPVAPSINDYWVGIGKRRGYAVKPNVKRYREEIRLLRLMNDKIYFTGRILMRVNFFPPDRRRRDIDNICKGLLDALQRAGFYEDDNQIDELHIIRREVQPPGCLQVMLQEIGA